MNIANPLLDELQKLRCAVEQSPVATLITDTEGCIAYVSAGYTQQTGFTAQEMLGQSIAQFEPHYALACTHNQLWDRIRGGGVLRGTVQSRRKNGTQFWETQTFSGIRDDEGQLIQLLLSKENVSQRKKAEEKSLRSEAFALAIMESIADAIVVVDRRAVIVQFNRAWRSFTDESGACPHAAAVHTGIDCNFLALCGHGLFFASDADADAVRAGVQAVLSGRLAHFTHDYLCKARPKPLWFSLTATPLGPGQSGAVLSSSDITARKEMELETKRYQDGLEHMVGNSTRQLGTLAFELMKTETRERRSLAEDLHDDLGQHLSILKLKLSSLALPGPYAGHTELLEQLRDIESIVDRSTESVRSISTHLSPPVLHQDGINAAMHWLADEMLRTYGLQVNLDCEENLPLNDAVNGSIYRTVRELLINVWKHASVDSAEVSIRLSEGKDMVEIMVADEGLGFDVIEMQKPSSKLSFGIYSIRERMNLIGGTLRIDSSPGLGTLARLQFPARILTTTLF